MIVLQTAWKQDKHKEPVLNLRTPASANPFKLFELSFSDF